MTPFTRPFPIRIIAVTVLLQLLTACMAHRAAAQQRKNVFPIWTFHQRHLNIHDVSLGLISTELNTYTNGIRLELIGLGFALPLIPRSPIATSDSEYNAMMQEKIPARVNGLSLAASGTVCTECVFNGATLGLVSQVVLKVNGISAVGLMNFSQLVNGLQLGFLNESYHIAGVSFGAFNLSTKVKGLQIGALNKTRYLHGVQIGLWNINSRRKLPLVNWNFKKV
jgi:hypothetical protein